MGMLLNVDFRTVCHKALIPLDERARNSLQRLDVGSPWEYEPPNTTIFTKVYTQSKHALWNSEPQSNPSRLKDCQPRVKGVTLFNPRLVRIQLDIFCLSLKAENIVEFYSLLPNKRNSFL